MFRIRTSGLLISGVLALAGCSLIVGELPEPLPNDAGVVQAGGSGGASGGTSGNGQGGSGQSGHSSNADDPDASDSGMSQAGEQPDAAGGLAGSRGDGGFDPCDRDGDGEPNEGCGGEDCDDDDRRVHPGQEEFFDQESETVDFDYNCSGDIEREYPTPLTCSIESCDLTRQGFLDALPMCGEQGNWGQCIANEPVGLMCTAQSDVMRRAACH